MNQLIDNEYKNWIKEIKAKIRTTQLRAAVAINSSLIEFYWDLGKMIAENRRLGVQNSSNRLPKTSKMNFP
jgi:hypothetical protein